MKRKEEEEEEEEGGGVKELERHGDGGLRVRKVRILRGRCSARYEWEERL